MLNVDPSTLGFLLILPDRKALEGPLNCIVALKPGPPLDLKFRRINPSVRDYTDVGRDRRSPMYNERRTERVEREESVSSSSSRGYDDWHSSHHEEMEEESESVSYGLSAEEDEMDDRTLHGHRQYTHSGEDGNDSTTELQPAWKKGRLCKRGATCWFHAQGLCWYNHGEDQGGGRPSPGTIWIFAAFYIGIP